MDNIFKDAISVKPAYVSENGRPAKGWCAASNPHSDDAAQALLRNGTYCPDIVKIEKWGPATHVYFQDGTRSTVVCQAEDHYCLEAGIAQAIVKRIVGIPDEHGQIQDSGCGKWLKKMTASAVDMNELQEKRKAEAEAEKARRAENRTKKAERVKAKQARDVRDKVETLVEILRGLGISIPQDAESGCSCGGRCGGKPASETNTYVRPDKKFKDFTQDEKREYWREQKRAR